ncbi:epidermal growth factor-like protein 7 isoform X4 [Corythoichthys intestinalis]|uniref:epidermal growth factor-like protein 7 isoform X4 n=1 Tax=Corythoichthys intestinalis TaxID=161448 RepID=UPI0025A4EC75|nr:epidermal growth factor-like protein 7 isoform X4 [Corythoichthys intestinalis]
MQFNSHEGPNSDRKSALGIVRAIPAWVATGSAALKASGNTPRDHFGALEKDQSQRRQAGPQARNSQTAVRWLRRPAGRRAAARGGRRGRTHLACTSSGGPPVKIPRSPSPSPAVPLLAGKSVRASQRGNVVGEQNDPNGAPRRRPYAHALVLRSLLREEGVRRPVPARCHDDRVIRPPAAHTLHGRVSGSPPL